MHVERFSFGSIQIDGVVYEHDIVVDRGTISKRKKQPSKQFRGAYGHTPLSLREAIPWKCRKLIIGSGAHGSLPVMDDVKREADQRGVKLVILPTEQAIEELKHAGRHTNALLHVTC